MIGRYIDSWLDLWFGYGFAIGVAFGAAVIGLAWLSGNPLWWIAAVVWGALIIFGGFVLPWLDAR